MRGELAQVRGRRDHADTLELARVGELAACRGGRATVEIGPDRIESRLLHASELAVRVGAEVRLFSGIGNAQSLVRAARERCDLRVAERGPVHAELVDRAPKRRGPASRADLDQRGPIRQRCPGAVDVVLFRRVIDCMRPCVGRERLEAARKAFGQRKIEAIVDGLPN